MERRLTKVELFQQIRHDYEFNHSSIRAIARKFAVHRRIVRQALASASPPDRKLTVRSRPKIDLVAPFIDSILESDRKAPRKQRHTAHRIFVRLSQEFPEVSISERTVRDYVRKRKDELGLLGREVFVPQSYSWGAEAQVDWYEAEVDFDGQRQTIQFFSMRSSASGAAFHRAYLRATQQAFLEAHQLAFHYFGGVFSRIRYDNLKSAVKKILQGHRRQETERFLLFRSHWQYEASFCNPASGHEKGGVEGEVGYFRRNHLVPVPVVSSLDELNDFLLEGCNRDLARVISGRSLSVGEAVVIERAHLLALQAEDFDLAEESFLRVDSKGCVCVRTNFYSTPLRPGLRVRVQVLPTVVEVIFDGQVVASHPRCYSRQQQILDLEHYLDVLERKPGAFAGSKPLEQWRAAGRWTDAHDQLWLSLQSRHGTQAGTRKMIELLQMGRKVGYERLSQAIEQALELGTRDAAAVRYLMTQESLALEPVELLEPGQINCIEHFGRAIPYLSQYDELISLRKESIPQEVLP